MSNSQRLDKYGPRCFSPNIHLRHNRLCLHENLNTVIVSVCLSGLCAVGFIFMHGHLMTVSMRSERRKGTPLRNHTNKDIYYLEHWDR